MTSTSSRLNCQWSGFSTMMSFGMCLFFFWLDNQQICIMGNDAKHNTINEPRKAYAIYFTLAKWIWFIRIGNVNTLLILIKPRYNNKVARRLTLDTIINVELRNFAGRAIQVGSTQTCYD